MKKENDEICSKCGEKLEEFDNGHTCLYSEENEEICTCDESVDNWHICPFQAEMNGDEETMCSCCDFCTTQCALDI